MEQKKIHDNSNVVTLRTTPHVKRELDEREETGRSLSSIVDRDLGRYYYLLRTSLPTFSMQEAMILVNALNGHITQSETVHLLWAEVEDFLMDQGIQKPHETAIVKRLLGFKRVECMAIADAIERVWNSETYHVDDMEDRLKKVGLVK